MLPLSLAPRLRLRRRWRRLNKSDERGTRRGARGARFAAACEGELRRC
ncbi:hypothetical protein E1A91_D06G100300v1 [Gossypium mustelinum]|uniref:Uncharacterized protein n=1 Tax=Gossypium mustelinum TaxID=34275 RepID=A0A5D2UJT4_GOSMU|nr:hypothetical protein E1A91_D06G100300v1 [Gossypium mustelinum]